MDKYKRYYGIGIFLLSAFILFYGSYNIVNPRIDLLNKKITEIEKKEKTLESKKKNKIVVEEKIKKLASSLANSQKKVYSPLESDLGSDSLFFTLYNDLLEMFQANSIKIKSIKYTYNPEDDKFVEFGKDVYFVCDINAEIISNYVNLGKIIQDIYQYPYYIKINSLKVSPYEKDKKILISKLSLRLYAHTEPQNN